MRETSNRIQHLSKELSLSENVLSTQLSTIDFYILTKSIISHNKESLQKSLYTQKKKVTFTDEGLPIFTANKTITVNKLFFFAISQSYFIFNSEFYNGMDGVAIGSSFQLLSFLISSWVFMNLSHLMDIILTNLNFIYDMLMTV